MEHIKKTLSKEVERQVQELSYENKLKLLAYLRGLKAEAEAEEESEEE